MVKQVRKVKILQLRVKFEIAMMPWSRFFWITISSDQKKVQMIYSSNPREVTRICYPNKSRSRHHRKLERYVYQIN